MRLFILLLLLAQFSVQGFSQQTCTVPTQLGELDINNVSTNYYNDGREWIDNQQGIGSYFVPQDSGTSSIFAGGIWIGGINEAGELRSSIRNFGQNPNEYTLAAGPMNNSGPGEFVFLDCSEYDRIYKINRSQVVLHRLYFEMLAENGGVPPTDSPFENGYEIPDVILDWPAHAEVIPGELQELAPFFDDDCCGGTPGVYEPELGDYPAFRFPDNEDEFDCEVHLLGDQVLWWVVSNSSTGLLGLDSNYEFLPTGFEIQNMAYAFIADDHLNNATFLRRTIINRSGWDYTDVYFGQKIDVDLGGAEDDYFGSDVERGMLYFYNGDNNDENNGPAQGYGTSPPAIGFDWVGGPLAELNDGFDNDLDGTIDEEGEQLSLSYAMYYKNDLGPVNGNPSNPQQFYNYLKGIWKDGSQLVYGGDGTLAFSQDTVPCKYMFPGASDPLWINTAGTPVEPWSEITENNASGDRRGVSSIGPFSFVPNEVKVFTLAIPWARVTGCPNTPCSVELLREVDDYLQELHDNCYELPCMVLDAQFDIEIENGEAFLNSPITSGIEYNWSFGDGTQLATSTPFATYQYESTGDFEVCLEIDFGCGTSSACQSIGGMLCDLMTGPELTQIEGLGNTGNYMELTEETISEILANDSSMVWHPTFKKGKGPVKVMVYDLEAIEEGDYTLQFDGTGAESGWKMFIQGTADTVYSEVPIGTPHTQFIEEWGLMVSVDAHLSDTQSQPVGSSLSFTNNDLPWLGHVEDTDDFTYQNWISEGDFIMDCPNYNCYFTDSTQTTVTACYFDDISNSSEGEGFEQMIGGGWAPSYYVDKVECHPFFDAGTALTGPNVISPGQIRNVDIVLTPNKDMWSRCPIMDLSYPVELYSNITLRSDLSVDKNGLNQNHPDCNVAEATYNGTQTDDFGMSYGMGWFPGYAIDVNTGKRLNLAFGENTNLTEDNGADMLWNPTSTVWTEEGEVVFGGTHSVVVLSNHLDYPLTNHTAREYNGGQTYYDSDPFPFFIQFTRDQQWTGLPILNEGFELLPTEEGLIPTETTIQLRLLHRYQNYLPGEENINNGNPLYNFTIDYEDLISSTEEFAQSHEVVLFPNPANDLLNIRISGFGNGNVPLEMYDLSGKLVKRESISTSGLSTIDTGQLNSGIYIIRVQEEGGTPQFKRLVIAR